MWGPISICLFFDCLILLSTSYHWRLDSIVCTAPFCLSIYPSVVRWAWFLHLRLDYCEQYCCETECMHMHFNLQLFWGTCPHVELLYIVVILWIILLGICKLPVSPCLSNTFFPRKSLPSYCVWNISLWLWFAFTVGISIEHLCVFCPFVYLWVVTFLIL